MTQIKIVGNMKFKNKVWLHLEKHGDDFTELNNVNVERLTVINGVNTPEEEFITVWQNGWSVENNNEHYTPFKVTL